MVHAPIVPCAKSAQRNQLQASIKSTHKIERALNLSVLTHQNVICHGSSTIISKSILPHHNPLH
jgi:hypothetical protein